MIDNRFPHLLRIQEAPIDPLRRRSAVRFADAVGRRTGVKMLFNRNTGGLFCYYGDMPDHGPCEIPSSFRLDSNDVDDTVRMLQYGHRSRAEKDRQMQAEEQAEAKQKEYDKEKFLDDNRNGVQEKADFLMRKRRGVSKVSITT